MTTLRTVWQAQRVPKPTYVSVVGFAANMFRVYVVATWCEKAKKEAYEKARMHTHMAKINPRTRISSGVIMVVGEISTALN